MFPPILIFADSHSVRSSGGEVMDPRTALERYAASVPLLARHRTAAAAETARWFRAQPDLGWARVKLVADVSAGEAHDTVPR